MTIIILGLTATILVSLWLVIPDALARAETRHHAISRLPYARQGQDHPTSRALRSDQGTWTPGPATEAMTEHWEWTSR